MIFKCPCNRNMARTTSTNHLIDMGKGAGAPLRTRMTHNTLLLLLFIWGNLPTSLFVTSHLVMVVSDDW